MKRYKVSFTESARLGIFESYEWGCVVWGEDKARSWAYDFQDLITEKISVMPKRFSLAPENDEVAPENDEVEEEVRQMIVNRYRVLFTIRDDEIFILHIRGSHIPDADE
jgi:hypothetical protein